jgi:hypothetical protein
LRALSPPRAAVADAGPDPESEEERMRSYDRMMQRQTKVGKMATEQVRANDTTRARSLSLFLSVSLSRSLARSC